MKKATINVGGLLVQLAGLAWVGLRVRPAPFAPVDRQPEPAQSIALPEGLPAPVERYYRATYGERVPAVNSGVVSGRGTMRLFGIMFPLRFRFMHEAGRNFRSYFELTMFGRPVMKVNEHYRDDKFRQELPFGVEEGEPKNDHSAALRMWSEWALWLPAMLLREPDVRWVPVDDTMALLTVPTQEGEEHLVVRFDPATGKAQHVEAMKYKHPADTAKTLWVNAVWFGDMPWASFDIEDVTLNAEVDTSVDAKGAQAQGERRV
ncbi:MAG TPA: DUF6544 family protein [Chloroflexia bacterium]|nr:DUF6544 family protein [Chloroflexia bacterium]